MLENVAMPALIGGENRAEAMRRAARLIDYSAWPTARATAPPSSREGNASAPRWPEPWSTTRQ